MTANQQPEKPNTWTRVEVYEPADVPMEELRIVLAALISHLDVKVMRLEQEVNGVSYRIDEESRL